MNRTLSRATALACASALALAAGSARAQQAPYAASYPNGQAAVVQPVARPNATYTETTVAVTANTWTLAAAASSGRQKLVLGDATGLGCVWSTTASPAAGQGFPFSLSGTPGSWVLDDPVATNLIEVKCTSTGVITVGAA